MQPWLFIIISIGVAAFVGGVTNHFAIKMLFHPREAVRLGSWRVPFTPGLIPKRKEEIASSLGDVVASYLVTTEGLQELLTRAHFRQNVVDKVTLRLQTLAEREPGCTIRELLAGWLSEDELQGKLDEWSSGLQQMSERGLEWLWLNRGLHNRRISELLPGWSDEAVQLWSDQAQQVIVEALKKELTSPSGQRMLRKLTSGLLENAGGFLGALAGAFMDEDKLLQRLTPVLIEQLSSETIRHTLRSMVGKQLTQVGEWTLEQAVSRLSGEEEPLAWLKRQASTMLRFEAWLTELQEVDLSGWLQRNASMWPSWVEKAADWGIGLAARNMNTIVKAVGLPELVKEQVQKFPVQRLEQIILRVSGKEFRAITWLGAALGGMIGFLQALFLLWLQ